MLHLPNPITKTQTPYLTPILEKNRREVVTVTPVISANYDWDGEWDVRGGGRGYGYGYSYTDSLIVVAREV